MKDKSASFRKIKQGIDAFITAYPAMKTGNLVSGF
jgi:hypothetical protein